MVQPLLMAWFLDYFSSSPTCSHSCAVASGLGYALMSAVYTACHHPYFFGVVHTGMRARVALSALVYRKALRLRLGQRADKDQKGQGQVVNLLSNDVARCDQAVIFIHYLWCGPLQLALVVALSWAYVGPATLAGAALVAAFAPLQSWIGRQFSRLRLETALRTDKRIAVMGEIIRGIKVIKMYAWEGSFGRMVHAARQAEVDVIRKTCRYKAFNFSFFFTSSKVILVAILVPYVLLQVTKII